VEITVFSFISSFIKRKNYILSDAVAVFSFIRWQLRVYEFLNAAYCRLIGLIQLLLNKYLNVNNVSVFQLQFRCYLMKLKLLHSERNISAVHF
jgi:hypothetical protein